MERTSRHACPYPLCKMPLAPAALLVLHFAASLVLAAYGYHRLTLAIRYRRTVRPKADFPDAAAGWPSVTVQVPLYNERYVAERVINAAGALDYPSSRLEVQILDDSTDETPAAVALAVRRLRARGLRVTHVRRASRTGFKAGALAHGLRRARGELVAIFDADFVPPRDFLRRLVGEFSDPRVGMVQARWGHLNVGASLLTQVQALQLDAHFTIEHGVRAATGCFFNFNGTAGIWRRRAIESAGGWHADTLTEDLDLSYRAQLAGWRFVYRDDVEAPAELPVEIAAYRQQQQRWAQGGIETAFKILPAVFRSSVPGRVKREACWHLTAHFAYPCLVVLALAGASAGWTLAPDHLAWLVAVDGLLLSFATLSLGFFYGIAAHARGRTGWWKRLGLVPAVMVLGAGITLSQSIAVARGILRRRTPFRRTPKYHQNGAGDRSWQGASYRISALRLALAECAAGFAMLAVGALVTAHQAVVLTGPILLFGAGFLATGGWALVQHPRRLSASCTTESGPRTMRTSALDQCA